MLSTDIQNMYKNLPYHNWHQHALTVRDRALAIAWKIDVPINVEALEIAALGHDVCFGDPNIKKHKSQEHFSAFVIGELLKNNYSYDKEFIKIVKNCIIATNAWVEPKTIEEKILRAADLGGLMSNDIYREDFSKLMAENKVKDERVFLLNSISFLTLYIWPSIELTPNYYNDKGASEWHSNTLGNIIRHYKELFDAPVTVEVGSGSNPCVLYENIDGLVIGIEPDKESRKNSISLLWGQKKTEIIVPGRGDKIPIEENIDSLRYYNVVLRHSDAFNEEEIRELLPNNVEIIESYTPSLGYKDADAAKAALYIDGYTKTEREATELPNASKDAYRLFFEIGNGLK